MMTKKKSTELAKAPASDLTPALDTAVDMLRRCTPDSADIPILREDARKAHKQLDQARIDEKAPHLQAGRDVDDRYRPVLETLSQVVRACTDILESRLAHQRAEFERLAANAAEGGDVAARHDALVAAARGVREVPSTVRLVVEYSYEIENFDDVPREWLQVDSARVNAHLKDTAGTARIPGLKVVRTERLVTRAGR